VNIDKSRLYDWVSQLSKESKTEVCHMRIACIRDEKVEIGTYYTGLNDACLRVSDTSFLICEIRKGDVLTPVVALTHEDMAFLSWAHLHGNEQCPDIGHRAKACVERVVNLQLLQYDVMIRRRLHHDETLRYLTITDDGLLALRKPVGERIEVPVRDKAYTVK